MLHLMAMRIKKTRNPKHMMVQLYGLQDRAGLSGFLLRDLV